MPALDELLAYHSVLAAVRGDLRGAAVLHTPGSPVIATNAAYLRGEPHEQEEGLVRASVWLRAQDAPVLIASEEPVDGMREVARLRVGTFTVRPVARGLAVEQVSRLALTRFSEVLTGAWEMPEWASSLSRTLALALEMRRDFTLLLAYDGEPVGALLLLPSGAHLWGASGPDVLEALLSAAAVLTGGPVRTSVPVGSFEIDLDDEGTVGYFLREDPPGDS